MHTRLEQAKQLLRQGDVTCVEVDENGLIWSSDSFGIKPLMERLRVDKKAFHSCVIADKIIGKAAALLMVLGEAGAVYGEVISESAIEVLENNNIYYEYGKRIPYVENRTHTGRCPMEETVLCIEEPQQAFEALEQTVRRLMAEKAKQ